MTSTQNPTAGFLGDLDSQPWTLGCSVPLCALRGLNYFLCATVHNKYLVSTSCMPGSVWAQCGDAEGS